MIGVTGYGRVSGGAQEALDALDPVTVTPGDVEALVADPPPDRRVYKVVFREEDTVEPTEAGAAFDFADFCAHPDRYRGTFARFLPLLSVLVNAVYWEERYPRLVTRADLRDLWARGGRPRLSAIGDVTCDICGSVECTVKDTHVDDPVYVYDPVDDIARDGVEGRGVLMMAVGNLPCELARDASESFSHILATFMPALIAADFTVPFEQLALPDELKRALILHHGELTPDYEYLRSFL